MKRTLCLLLACWTFFLPLLAWADGTQFNGQCQSVSWNANTEPDLAGYKIYDRVSLSGTPAPIGTFNAATTTVTCQSFGFNPGQHYLSISSYDTSGNESGRSAESPFVIVVTNQVGDLIITVVNTTSFTIRFTQPDDGAGNAAKVEVRIASPTISWGTASDVASGTCAPGSFTPGTLGSLVTCTIIGLTNGVHYQVQLAPYRGTLNVDAVFGPLSNITEATTGGAPPGTPGDRYTIDSDGFNRLGPTLGTKWQAGYTRATLEMEINVGVIESTSTSQYSAMVFLVPLPQDQWAQTKIATFNTGPGGFIAQRFLVNAGLPPTSTFYEVVIQGNGGGVTSSIRRYVNGTDTITDPFESSTTWTAGDTVRVESKGGVVTLYRKPAAGAEVTVLSYTDPAPLTGSYAGYFISTLSPAVQTDNQADDFTVGGFIPAASTDPCGCDAT